MIGQKLRKLAPYTSTNSWLVYLVFLTYAEPSHNWSPQTWLPMLWVWWFLTPFFFAFTASADWSTSTTTVNAAAISTAISKIAVIFILLWLGCNVFNFFAKSYEYSVLLNYTTEDLDDFFRDDICCQRLGLFCLGTNMRRGNKVRKRDELVLCRRLFLKDIQGRTA